MHDSAAMATGNARARSAGWSMHRGDHTVVKPALSEREIEVLLTWLRYDSKQQAADELYISVATVNTHIARIRQKYADAGRAAHTKAELVARALQDGYTTLEQW